MRIGGPRYLVEGRHGVGLLKELHDVQERESLWLRLLFRRLQLWLPEHDHESPRRLPVR